MEEKRVDIYDCGLNKILPPKVTVLNFVQSGMILTRDLLLVCLQDYYNKLAVQCEI